MAVETVTMMYVAEDSWELFASLLPVVEYVW